MKPIHLRSAASQVATHLQREIARGALVGDLPGVHALASRLAVNHKTIAAAIRTLEKEGLVEARGRGKARKIVPPAADGSIARLRVAILNYDPPESIERYAIEMLYALLDSGHQAFFSGRSLIEMKMDPERVMRHVAATKADAWVVVAGSDEVLAVLAKLHMPTFALFGRNEGLPIAWSGPRKSEATRQATRRLIELGHRRIVMIVRKERREPTPGVSEQAFLDELHAHGIATGPYHLPDWAETTAGFHMRLDSLFRSTPPTALIIDQASFFFAAQQHLMSKRLRVPHDVSLVCRDGHADFTWFQPSVAHIDWDYGPVIKALLRWAADTANGKPHHRQTPTKANFIDGGTIGPAPR